MSMAKIEHVVLLMLENRSFDSMLGWAYEKGDTPSLNIPAALPTDRFRGLQSIYTWPMRPPLASGWPETIAGSHCATG